MEEALSATLAPRRFNLVLVGTFAVVALGLAVTGLYTVTAQLVTRRTREIGIRVALGARPGQVLRLVLGESALLVAGGLCLGALGAYGVGHLLDSLLFDVARTDGSTFAMVSGALVATGAPGQLPARAARPEPRSHDRPARRVAPMPCHRGWGKAGRKPADHVCGLPEPSSASCVGT